MSRGTGAGVSRAIERESAKAANVAQRYADTPDHPDSRQQRRKLQRVAQKAANSAQEKTARRNKRDDLIAKISLEGVN